MERPLERRDGPVEVGLGALPASRVIAATPDPITIRTRSPAPRRVRIAVDCHVLVDRSGGLTTLTSPVSGRVYPVSALWILDLPTYEPGPATCPPCAAGEPLLAPGSTGTGGAA